MLIPHALVIVRWFYSYTIFGQRGPALLRVKGPLGTYYTWTHFILFDDQECFKPQKKPYFMESFELYSYIITVLD